MRPCILLIDDDERLVAALRLRLEESGFAVAAAADGASGLAAAAEHRPGAIVLDLHLPDLDGYDVCRRLAADVSLASIPVIVLSGKDDAQARRAAFDVGAADFLAKPYNSLDVLAALRSVVNMDDTDAPARRSASA
ncbi:MAG: response regulator [Planctomycetes bacterium]|nr:response regulator [Planctomycetota bacterium]